MPGGGVDSRQTGSIQEATVMQSDADEVGGAVGGRAYKQATVGHKVENLEGQTPADKQQHDPREEIIFIILPQSPTLKLIAVKLLLVAVTAAKSTGEHFGGIKTEGTCSMASIRVMVFPVPGGPKST